MKKPTCTLPCSVSLAPGVRADADLPGLIAAGRGDVPRSGALEPGAYLEPGDLSGTVGLLAQQLHGALGDAAIKLPEGLALPAH